MVDPSPPISFTDSKAALRRAFRQARAEHVDGLPAGLRALMLNRPPAPLVEMIPADATVGVYHPAGSEAPALGWARWLSETGRRVALPWFASRNAPMEFRIWHNPWDETALTPGPWRALQPGAEAEAVVPDLVVVPLLAFTANGHRLGQGGGHYDRWLDAHPEVPAVGLAWDCQLAEELPIEDHDRALVAVVTPTRMYHVEPVEGA
ncbi:5-formyltetrahydrofolate cyclo-ligase [Sphingobium sp.]|uniref:5-formyltetrahydrofolate cyclo-ligase n=1 Tax=Sphingobium sp. TaxID=1912891 RepID=UPI002CE381F2|nr:5-formyltetrahydrofolate cyclo-ligase [Sphingobium sp.]HUD91355.1 5-formyltetrahydrofolate cyclo-ligase [Sphingobium sp.]